MQVWMGDGTELTKRVIALKVPRLSHGIRDAGINRRDNLLRSADKGRASVDGRVTILP